MGFIAVTGNRGTSSTRPAYVSPTLCQKRVGFLWGHKKRTRDFRRKSLPGTSRGDCRSFEPLLPDYVDVLLQPDPYLRQFERVTRQCA